MAKDAKRISKTSPPTFTTSKTVIKSRAKPMPTNEQIRARAFEIYLARNGGPGDAQADWVQAERELTQELSK